MRSIEASVRVSDEEVRAEYAKAAFTVVGPDERLLTEASFAQSNAATREALLKQRQSARVARWLAEVRGRAKLQSLAEPEAPSEN